MGWRYRFGLLLVLFAGVIMILAPSPVQAQYTEKQQKIIERMQKLSEEMQRCGEDQNCFQEKMKEMGVLSREMMDTGGAGGMPSPQEARKQQADMEAVKAAMAHRQHEPCYYCELEQAIVRKQGHEPNFLCIPIMVHLTWNFSEQRLRANSRIGPSSWVKAVIEERFQGCLQIVYQTRAKRQLQTLEFYGPYPVDPAKASRTITQISSSFGLSQPSRIPFAGDVFTTVSSGNPDHFELEPFEERGALSYTCSTFPVFNNLKIRMPEINARDDLFVPKDWDMIEAYDWGEHVDLRLDNVFTCDEILRAVRTESPLTRTLPFHDQYFLGQGTFGVDHITDGTVSVKISFGPMEEPGLKVSPADGLVASGPDKKGAYKPDRKTYTLSNTGKAEIQYKVHAGKDWVVLSRKSGVIPPKASTQITVSVNAAKARKLGSEQRQDTVQFTNATNGRGNTARPVKLGNQEKWRVTWTGWDTLFFGGNTLAGGLKTYWQVRADFIIEDDKYKEGQGTARFLKFESHSHPPGVYDCEPLKGWALDAQLKKHPTPYIKVHSFNIPGSSTSSSAALHLPKENYYLVDYYCVMDSDHAKVALGKSFGKIGAKEKVQQSRKYASIEKNARLLPSGQQKIPLQDGWKQNFGETESMDAHVVEVKRIE